MGELGGRGCKPGHPLLQVTALGGGIKEWSQHFNLEAGIDLLCSALEAVFELGRRSDQIEIVLPQTLAGRETPHFIYSGLDTDVAFASILRHELTHAVVEHTTEDRPISNAAHEYIAFAFQIDAMTDDERDVFLATNGQRPAKSLDTFNMFIYGLLPGAFASASCLHFSMPGHGCDFVGKIISGEVVLGAPRLSPP